MFTVNASGLALTLKLLLTHTYEGRTLQIIINCFWTKTTSRAHRSLAVLDQHMDPDEFLLLNGLTKKLANRHAHLF